MQTKVWYRSKTLWLNMAIAAATIFLDAAPDGVEWVALANMMLRLISTRALTIS